jgi:hypothetical protein
MCRHRTVAIPTVGAPQRVANQDVIVVQKNIDCAAAAKAFGVHGEGPISNPKELAPAPSPRAASRPWSMW